MAEHDGSLRNLSHLNPILLWTAVAFLGILNLLIYGEVAGVRSELESLRQGDRKWPLSAQEVARQFEKSTTLPPIRTTVNDVRYSPDANSYKVDFSWTNTTTGKTWSSDVELAGNGYGAYYGQIRNGPFIDPLGHKEAYSFAVETPSPLME